MAETDPETRIAIQKGITESMKRLAGDAIFESGHLSQDLGRRSVRGGMTTMTAQGIQFVLQMARTMILARLLTPADFGLIGMVMVVVGFAEMFKDAGLSIATVQKDTITREQISTLFWLNVLLTGILGACILAASPLVAWFYGRPELTAATAVLSLSFLITGLTIQHAALLRRHMRFGTLATISIASHIVNLVVAVLLALAGWRHWALVGGSLATALSVALLTLYFCPWTPGRMQRKTGVRGMLKFGAHLTAFNFVNYFARNADNVLIGKFLGAGALGLYARAYQLFMMPIQQVRDPLNQVALPVLCSLKKQPQRYLKYYQRLIDIVATLTIPLTFYCVVEADFLIRLLLGQQWLAAVPVFRILAIAGAVQPVASTRGLVLVSQGFPDRYLYWGLFNAVLAVASFVAGLPFGIEGVAAAYTMATYVVLIPSLFYCFHKTPVTVSLFLWTVVSPMLAAAAATACVFLAKYAGAGNSFSSHVLYAGIFATVYGGLSWCRASIRETSLFVRRGLPVFRKPAATPV